jgi:hypothetical protein
MGGACTSPALAGEVASPCDAGEGSWCGSTLTLVASRLDLSREERAR